MIIGLSGFSKAGKDEAAKALYPQFTRVAFADALKRELAISLGVSLEELEQRKEEFRGDMVELGRSRRAEDPDYWIKATQPLPTGDVVVTDVRYLNEARWIKEQGGYIIYVVRPGYKAANEEELNSIAEILQRNMINSVVINDGSVKQLHQKVRRIQQMHKFWEEEAQSDKRRSSTETN